MSNPETTLVWHPLRDRLAELRRECLAEDAVPPHWDRIESLVGSGVPDLNWSWAGHEGWIELKHRASPPVGEDTPVVLDTITSHQRLFWRQRWESGGNVYVLVRVAQCFMLLQGYWCAFNLGKVTLESLRDHSSWLAESPADINVRELLRKARRS